jgi:hypothetical protein
VNVSHARAAAIVSGVVLAAIVALSANTAMTDRPTRSEEDRAAVEAAADRLTHRQIADAWTQTKLANGRPCMRSCGPSRCRIGPSTKTATASFGSSVPSCAGRPGSGRPCQPARPPVWRDYAGDSRTTENRQTRRARSASRSATSLGCDTAGE